MDGEGTVYRIYTHKSERGREGTVYRIYTHKSERRREGTVYPRMAVSTSSGASVATIRQPLFSTCLGSVGV